VLGLEFVVKLPGDPLDIQRFPEPLGHFDHGRVTGGIEFADIEDQGVQFAQEEIARLMDFEIVFAGIDLAVIPFNPIPEALVSVRVDEDEEILLVQSPISLCTAARTLAAGIVPAEAETSDTETPPSCAIWRRENSASATVNVTGAADDGFDHPSSSTNRRPN